MKEGHSQTAVSETQTSAQQPKKSKLRPLSKKTGILVFACTFAVVGIAFLAYSFAAQPEDKIPLKGVRGEVAIDVLGKRLPEVAKKHGMTSEELSAILKNDNTIEITMDDELLYVDPGPSETAQDIIDNNLISATTSEIAQTVGLSDAFNLHSNPNSSLKIYLDYDGHTTSGTSWNTNFNNGQDIVSAPFDFDGNPASFSDTERQRIIDMWAAVSEDYAPFNVDVTTADPGTEGLKKSSSTDTEYGIRAVISPTNWYSASAGGVAYLSSFGKTTDTPVYCFSGSLSTSTYKSIAECISHESGHSVSLKHDGFISSTGTVSSYYMGHGNWAPIMGVAYYDIVSQWSKGEYTGATNGSTTTGQQDDLAIIASFLSLKPDDTGNDRANARDITLTNGLINQNGLIGNTGDVDVYRFTWGGGGLIVTAKSSVTVSDTSRPANDLDMALKLTDASGQQIVYSDPGGAIAAPISVDLPAGTYYLEVTGVGYLDPATTGYSNYASLGAYTIFSTSGGGTTPPPPPTNLAPTAKITATPSTGVAPLSVAFSSAGSSDPEGKALTYSWNLGNGQTSTAANPSTSYVNPGNYTVTLTVRDDVGLTGQTTTIITVKATQQTMTISSVTMKAVTIKKQRYAEVTIKIVDQLGNPVSGAVITGSWSGLVTGTSSATTGGDGTVMIRSKTIRRGGSLTFTVNNVSYTSTILNYVWDGTQKSASVTF